MRRPLEPVRLETFPEAGSGAEAAAQRAHSVSSSAAAAAATRGAAEGTSFASGLDALLAARPELDGSGSLICVIDTGAPPLPPD
jgi:hypothetical protein